MDDSEKAMNLYQRDLPPPNYEIVPGLESWNDDVSGEIKHDVVSKLFATTDLDYEAVNGFIHQWAKTSNDTDYKALSIQETAARVFGTELSEYQKGRIVQSKGRHRDLTEHILKKEYAPHYASPQAATEDVLKKMYADTQNQFKEAGIKTVTLYRGTQVGIPGAKMGEKVNLKSNALESYTFELLIAQDFGTSVIKVQVPVERILSTPRTGFGCLNEYECVVIGNKPGDVGEVVGVYKERI